MVARRHVLVLLAVVALSLPAVTPATSSAPPETLCSVCSGELESVAEDRGVALDAAESRLTIRIADDGSSRWTARVRLREGADELRGDGALRRSLVAETTARHVVDERRNLTTAVEGETFVVRYRGPDGGYRSAGVFVFDLLAREPNRAGVTGGADRVVLRAPPNGSVATAPDDAATWNASAVVWAGGDESGARVEQSYVTFTPEGTVLAGLRGRAAVALAVGPSFLRSLASATALPIFALVAAGLSLARQADRTPRTGTGRRSQSSLRPPLALALAAICVAVAATYAGRGSVPAAPSLAASLVVPTAAFFALGYADEEGQRRALVAVLALLPVVAAFALDLVGLFGLVAWVPLTAGTLALGIPAFYVGRDVSA